MCDPAGWIVRPTAGHDRGTLLLVVGQEADGRLLLADGKRRKGARPKKKKMGHVEAVDRGEFLHPVTQKLRRGEPVTDRELRQALGAFKGEMKLGKR